jgi:hypothetical protein
MTSHIKSLNPDMMKTLCGLSGKEIYQSGNLGFLQLNVGHFDSQSMLNEALEVFDQFVPHLPKNASNAGWRSLCLRGISPAHTDSFHKYGFSSEAEVPYQWTDIATKCPKTVSFIKQLDIADPYYRVRFMLLEPGGYIGWHSDRSVEQKKLHPVNIALNMPYGCRWFMEGEPEVPFYPGSVFAVDISRKHAVINESKFPRIHIIIHGRFNKKYFDLIKLSVESQTTTHTEKKKDV